MVLSVSLSDMFLDWKYFLTESNTAVSQADAGVGGAERAIRTGFVEFKGIFNCPWRVGWGAGSVFQTNLKSDFAPILSCYRIGGFSYWAAGFWLLALGMVLARVMEAGVEGIRLKQRALISSVVNAANQLATISQVTLGLALWLSTLVLFKQKIARLQVSISAFMPFWRLNSGSVLGVVGCPQVIVMRVASQKSKCRLITFSISIVKNYYKRILFDTGFSQRISYQMDYFLYHCIPVRYKIVNDQKITYNNRRQHPERPSMSAQVKSQQFKNQIRRRHKEKIVSQLRSKLYYCDQEEDLFQILSKWRQYEEAPSAIVPVEGVKYFSHIEHSSFKKLERVVNEVLDAQSLLNVIFVALCVETYEIQSTDFFVKAVHHGANGDFEEVRYFTKLISSQEIYMDYYVKFLKGIGPGEKPEVKAIQKVKEEFVEYWNNNVDGGTLNNGLCAEMAQRLLPFIFCIQGLKSLISGIVSVLIDKDTSIQTFYLLKMILTCDPKLGLHIIHHPNFPECLYNGFKDPTVRSAIKIIELIMSRQEYGKNQIKYLEILKAMYRLLMKTENKKNEGYLLDGLYNFAFSGLKEIEEFFQEINYEEMCCKIELENMFNFLDFCLSALYNYPSLALSERILKSKTLKLIELSCQHILTNNHKKTWEYARDLFETLQQLIEKEIVVPGLAEDLEQVLKKLDEIEWTTQLKQKEKIMQDYEQLLQKCRPQANN